MLENRQHIWRTSLIKDRVLQNHGADVSTALIAKVLREDFQMRYQKVKKIPFAGNSERSLSLRFVCAQKLLEHLSAGKRLLNVDESWISETDLRRRKWRRRGDPNSIPTKELGLRVSLLVAIDASGRSYSSISHANTDAETFRLFLWKLTAKL